MLTIAYTTGTRVGGILPCRCKERAKKRSPITRENIRKVNEQYHIWQPKSKTDREGRGRRFIVSPTNRCACPARAVKELLLCPADACKRLFSGGGKTPTSEWFLLWLRYGLYQIGVKENWKLYSVRSCRKGACSAATQAKMPEYFTDTLGNWKSRAKETYRRTMLTKAQTQFCEYLGGAVSSQPRWTKRTRSKPKGLLNPERRQTAVGQMWLALQRMHGSALQGSRTSQLKAALRLMHAGVNVINNDSLD